MRLIKFSAKNLFVISTICALSMTACVEPGDAEGQAAESSTSNDSTTNSKPVTDGAIDEESVDESVQRNSGEEGFLAMVEPQQELATSSSGVVVDIEARESELVLTFEMGSQQCHGVAPSVVETTDEVVVDLQIGLRTDIEEVCVEGVYPYRVALQLDAPLGDRSVRVAESQEPVEVTAPTVEDATQKPSVDHLLGMPIEDGVQWAIEHDVEWHLGSYDGVVREEPAGSDGNRLTFIADSDRITKVEWK